MRLELIDVQFSCTSFDPCKKFARGCPPTQTPTQKLKSVFERLSSQKIGSSSVSLNMIFCALQSELFNIQILFSESKNPWIQPTDNASFFKYFSSLGYLPLLEQLSEIYSTLLSS